MHTTCLFCVSLKIPVDLPSHTLHMATKMGYLKRIECELPVVGLLWSRNVVYSHSKGEKLCMQKIAPIIAQGMCSSAARVSRPAPCSVPVLPCTETCIQTVDVSAWLMYISWPIYAGTCVSCLMSQCACFEYLPWSSCTKTCVNCSTSQCFIVPTSCVIPHRAALRPAWTV